MQVTDQHSAPPDYDTLSIAPPAIDDTPAQNEANDSQSPPETDGTARSRRKSMKERWQELKDEDEARKASRLQYVTHEEADKIAGLDKHKEREKQKIADGKKRGRGILGAALIL